MFVRDITDGASINMLEKTLAFTEARNRMMAENIANITTPGYRAKQLDVTAFQAALREAATKQKAERATFELPETEQFRMDDHGRLKVTPSQEPADNALFHDGTNARIERQMAQLAENAMMNQFSTEILKGYYDGLVKAVRGRVT